MNWTTERARELQALQELVGLAGGLNDGSNVCGKIARLEALEHRLTRDVGDRQSFMAFLIGLCIAERVAFESGKQDAIAVWNPELCRAKMAQIALILDGWAQPEPEGGWPEGELSDRQVLRWIAEVLT